MSVYRSRTISSPWASWKRMLFARSKSYWRGSPAVLVIGMRSKRPSLHYIRMCQGVEIDDNEPMPSSSHERLRANPVHIHKILTAERFSDITKRFGCGFFLLLFLTLQRIEAHCLVRPERIDVSARIHETGVRDGRPVIDDLIQRVFLFSLGCVEDVNESICA